VSNDERRRVFVASRDLRDVRQLEALLADHDWGIADFINVGVCPVEADKHLRAIGINRPCGSHRILSRESGKDVRGEMPSVVSADRKTRRISSPAVPHDIHLLDSRHVEKSLPEFFGDASQFAQRHTRSFDRVERERDVRVFVVHERPDCALRQFARLITQFLSRLVKLIGNFFGRSFVNELQCHQRQPWSRDGFHAIIPAQLLESLLQRLGHEILHFLGGRSGPRPQSP
jgi:hypothetical protein